MNNKNGMTRVKIEFEEIPIIDEKVRISELPDLFKRVRLKLR